METLLWKAHFGYPYLLQGSVVCFSIDLLSYTSNNYDDDDGGGGVDDDVCQSVNSCFKS